MSAVLMHYRQLGSACTEISSLSPEVDVALRETKPVPGYQSDSQPGTGFVPSGGTSFTECCTVRFGTAGRSS